MHVVLAVFKRNLNSYLSGVLGYLFMAAFLIGVALAAFNDAFFANNLANPDQLSQWFPLLLVGLIPAITMSAWADERRFGTDELLFTLPASDLQILIGKFLAAVGIYSVTLLIAFATTYGCLWFMGAPDVGLLVAAFLGYWLAGVALVAAGMVASAGTRSPTVAYLLGLVTTGIPVVIFYYPSLFPYSVAGNLEDFSLGLISPAAVIYFVSLTILMLFVNYVLITGRFWSTGPGRASLLVLATAIIPLALVMFLALMTTRNPSTVTALALRLGIVAVLAGSLALASALRSASREWSTALKFGTEFIALGVILVSLYQTVGATTFRMDFTREQLYSTSATTQRVLSSVPADKQVRLTAYISPDVPRQYAQTRNTLLGLLRTYGQYRNVLIRIVDTRQHSEQAKEAQQFGIDGKRVASEEAGRIVTKQVFMGVHVAAGDSEVTIPMFDTGTPVEYELTRSIHTLTQPARKRVGILRTDAKISGGFDMNTFQQTPEWRFVSDLKKQYEVKDVDPNELATQQFDVLVAVMPSSLNDTELPSLVNYVKQGNPTLIIDDPFPLTHPNLAPKAEKPRPGGPFGQGGPPPQPKADGGSLKQLLDVLELEWNVGETVWDTYNPEIKLSEIARIYDLVYVDVHSGSSAPFNKENPITSGLQEVLLLYPGSLLQKPGGRALKHDALLRVSPKGYLRSWDEYAEIGGGFFGGGGPRPKLGLEAKEGDGKEWVMAMQVRGEKTKDSKTRPINAVVIADMDLISDEFFGIRDEERAGLELDNIALVCNAVDVLAGDPANVDLRKRRGQHRTLKTVENVQAAVNKREVKEIQDLKGQIEKFRQEKQQEFADAIKRIEEDTSLSKIDQAVKIQTIEQQKQRQLDVLVQDFTRKTEDQVQSIRDDAEMQRLSIQRGFQWTTRLLMPLPAVLIGLGILALRISEENQGAVPERMVSKKK